MNNLTSKVVLQAFVSASAGATTSPAAATCFLKGEQNSRSIFFKYKLNLDSYDAYSTNVTVFK